MSFKPGSGEALAEVLGVSADIVTVAVTVSVGATPLELVAAPGANNQIKLRWIDWVPNSAASVAFKLTDGTTGFFYGDAGVNTATALNNYKPNINILFGANKAVVLARDAGAGAVDARVTFQYSVVNFA